MNQTIGRIEEISFYSASLQEDVTLLVYLPVNYTPAAQTYSCHCTRWQRLFSAWESTPCN